MNWSGRCPICGSEETSGGCPTPHVHRAPLATEITDLRARLAASEAEVARTYQRWTAQVSEMCARLRAACDGSPPSAGHDLVDEVIGLLRVTRGQRDAAEARADAAERTLEAATKRDCDELAALRLKYAAALDDAADEDRRAEAAEAEAKRLREALQHMIEDTRPDVGGLCAPSRGTFNAARAALKETP